MLVDQFHRTHTYLRISLTERCNLRCFYCMPEEGVELSPRSNLMTTDEIINLAKLFVKNGVSKIRLTGGEPLVRKDAAIIIQELGKLPIELSLTSNGILIDRFIPTLLQSQIKSVNISLDTLDKDRFNLITKRNDFDKVIQNIHLLLAADIDVKVNVVLMRGINDSEVTDFIRLSEQLPLQIRFIEFMPFDGNQWDLSKCVSLQEILETTEKEFGGEAIIKLQDKANDTAKNYQIKGFKGSFAIISTVTNPFCDSCNRIRLTANGKLKNCLFSTNEMDLLTPLREGKEVLPLIQQHIKAKKAIRGGFESIESFGDNQNHEQNRSMILIGG